MTTPEVFTADQFLYSRLTADGTLSALGVYGHEVPEGVSYPLIEFRALSDLDVSTQNSRYIVMTNSLYVVVAIQEFRAGRPSFDPLTDYAARIHTQLQRQGTTTASGTVYAAVREYPYRQAYEANGFKYRELGAVYRVFTQGAG